MSSIDKISINRPEPDHFLAEERRRQLARQHQLQLRETTRLVLPSVETQSRLSSKRALGSSRPDNGPDTAGFAEEEEADNAYSLKQVLLGLVLNVGKSAAGKSTDDLAESLTPRFKDRRDARNAGSGLDNDGKDAVHHSSLSTAAHGKDTSRTVMATLARGAAIEHVEIAEKSVEDRKLSDSRWLQKLETAFAQSRNASSQAATDALEDVLDQLMHEVQTYAVQPGPLAPELEAALDALSKQSTAAFKANPDFADTSRLQGSYRFLDAFLETMAGTPRGEIGTGTRNDYTHEKPGLSVKSTLAPEFDGEVVKAGGSNCKSDGENVSSARDRQTLYEFLESLSSVSASSTSVAMQRLAQARQTHPEQALLRLAASGDHSVALYAPEISRRFDLITARIERDDKKSARSSMLAEAVQTQKQRMESAISEADSIVGYSALIRRSEREQREKNLAETLPLLILQKS